MVEELFFISNQVFNFIFILQHHFNQPRLFMNSIRSFKFTGLFLVLLSFFFSCRSQFEDISPKTIHNGNISTLTQFGDTLNFKFTYSVPPEYSTSEKHPLVVALHGYGSNAEAFNQVLKPATDSLGMLLLVPQAENHTPEGIGYTWGENTEMLVLSTMDFVMKRMNVDTDEIYLIGFSMGGGYAYQLATNHSSAFKGFASLCAPFDVSWLGQNPLLRTDAKAYISHGEYEERFAEGAKNAVREFNSRGYDTKYTVYPNTRHTIPKPIINELMTILNFLKND